MKKRLNRQRYFPGILACVSLFLILCAVSIYLGENSLAIIHGSAFLVILVYIIIVQMLRKRDMNEYISYIEKADSEMSYRATTEVPLPVAIFSVDGMFMWYNDKMSEMIGTDNLYTITVGEIMPDLKWSEVLKSTDGIDLNVRFHNRSYRAVGRILKRSTNNEEFYSVILYFFDTTEFEKLSKDFLDDKTVIMNIVVDNYEEIFQKMDESDSQRISAQISKIINDWVSDNGGVIKKSDRDRYFVITNNRQLEKHIKQKFDILEKIRSIGEAEKLPVTVSIGIGHGDNLIDCDAASRAAVSMAQGRGGDQAVIKNDTQYSFFGGKSKDYEKSTRVKTRAFSVAFTEIISHTEKVIFMGHANADYDSFGAAIGLQRAVRSLGKTPYIVYDNAPAVKELVEEIYGVEEYSQMLISTEYAAEIITPDTLLVILDTHRPTMLPAPELLDRTQKVVLIDHHRRAAEFLPTTSLVYHEPYASSTCEMVTEVLQYMDVKELTPFEAKALYVGILMDTKNFILKTGVRTFEAASTLRRFGLNTVDVKKLFTLDKQDFSNKSTIISRAEVYNENMAIAVAAEKYPNMRVISSIAADDLLNISGITAAFVVYEMDNEIYVSARSLGSVNVQLICEKLGGGGHMTVSGAQLRGVSKDEAKSMLISAIDDYLTENAEK